LSDIEKESTGPLRLFLTSNLVVGEKWKEPLPEGSGSFQIRMNG